MPGVPQVYTSAKVAPVDHVTTTTTPNYARDIGRTPSSHSHHSQHSKHSQHSNNSQMLKSSGSHDGTPLPRRKRPLAVAVGFKYAEDANGRPIVITPGNRRMPVHGHRSNRSSPVSPASQSVDIAKKEVHPSILLPLMNNDVNGATLNGGRRA